MDTFYDKSILVTGAAGFVGSHIARRLSREGARVHVLVRPGADLVRLAGLEESIVIHEADITEKRAIERVFAAAAPVGVFHLAGVSQAFGSVPTTDQLVDVNIRASLHLMDIAVAQPLEFLVNTSSFVEVGTKSTALREDMLVEPTELYGISRLPALFYGQALGRKGKPIVTVRVFTPYGPFLQKGKLIYEVITRALRNESISLTRRNVTRDFIFIDDLVDLYLAAARGAPNHHGEVFNGGSGMAISLGDIAELILRLTGSHSAVSWQDSDVSYDAGHWEADTSKVRDMLNWQPTHSLEDGITDTIAWFRAHEEYWLSDA